MEGALPLLDQLPPSLQQEVGENQGFMEGALPLLDQIQGFMEGDGAIQVHTEPPHVDDDVARLLTDEEFKELQAQLPPLPPPTHNEIIFQQSSLNQQAIKKGSKILFMSNCNIQTFNF
jgi:hypothetical protein